MTGTCAYGIVPGTVSPDLLKPGPGAGAYLVPHDGIAAVVSDTLPGSEDLLAYQRLLDSLAARHPVLPLRFGTVLSSPAAVAGDLLAPGHQRFRAALAALDGCAQYLVKGRYVEETVLAEVLADSPEAQMLRAEINAVANPAATRHLRIRLGEIAATALAAKRAADTQILSDALAPCRVASVTREPGHPRDAVSLALLVKTARQVELERLAGQVASGWDGRVRLRVLGPMAPYDFAQGAVSAEGG